MQIRDLREPGYARVDVEVITDYCRRVARDGKTPGAYGLAVYTVLAAYANNTTQGCYPSLRLIAHDVQLCESTVIKTLRRLEDVGLISCSKRESDKGDYDSNEYTLLYIEKSGSKHVSGSVSNEPRGIRDTGRGALDTPGVVYEIQGGGLRGTTKLDLENYTQGTKCVEDPEPKTVTEPETTPPSKAKREKLTEVARWAKNLNGPSQLYYLGTPAVDLDYAEQRLATLAELVQAKGVTLADFLNAYVRDNRERWQGFKNAEYPLDALLTQIGPEIEKRQRYAAMDAKKPQYTSVTMQKTAPSAYAPQTTIPEYVRTGGNLQ
jgi:hypothetical protein